jgi:hypothetical protein
MLSSRICLSVVVSAQVHFSRQSTKIQQQVVHDMLLLLLGTYVRVHILTAS